MTMNQKALSVLEQISKKYGGGTAIYNAAKHGIDRRIVTYLKKVREIVDDRLWASIAKCIESDSSFVLSDGGKTKSIEILLNNIRKGNMPVEKSVSSKCVYIIKSDIYYKIGVSSSILSRVGIMQTGNPIKIEIVATFYLESDRDAYRLEAELHKKYSNKHFCGEWFCLSESDIDDIFEFFNN